MNEIKVTKEGGKKERLQIGTGHVNLKLLATTE
jgi:hypothetical protein